MIWVLIIHQITSRTKRCFEVSEKDGISYTHLPIYEISVFTSDMSNIFFSFVSFLKLLCFLSLKKNRRGSGKMQMFMFYSWRKNR